MDEARGKLILVTGGARSGKSTFAENYARDSGKKVIYIATAAAEDEEMRRRIEAHRQRRPQHFITREELYYPHRIIEEEGKAGSFILLDCLTLLLTNHLLKEEDGGERQFSSILEYITGLSLLMQRSPCDTLVVTNEVGMGLVPDNPLGRTFRDLAGRANQTVASAADEVWFTVCGIAQRIK